MIKRVARLSPLLACLGLTMCGGAAPEAGAKSPSNALPAEAAPSTSAPATSALPGGDQGPTAPAPASATAGTAEAPRDRELQRRAARAELDRAQADLDAGAGDCPAACRALGSMERAAAHLCALVDGPDDQRRCDDARQRVLAARDRVQHACGPCPR